MTTDTNVDTSGGQTQAPSQPSESFTGNAALDSRLDKLAGDSSGPQSKGDGASEGTRSTTGDGSSEDGTAQTGATGAAQAPGTQEGKQDKGPARPGDLIEKGTGRVLARAGSERRQYEKAMNDIYPRVQQQIEAGRQATQQVQELSQRLQVAEAAAQAYQSADRVAQQYNLKPQERDLAYRILSSYRQDPAGTLRFLLAEAAQAGITIDGVTSGFDAAATERMLDNKLQPIIGPMQQEQQRQQQYQQLEQEVARDYTAFVQKYPDATTHAGEIAKLMEAGRNEVEAYWEVKHFAASNGLDFSQPLGPQWQAKQQAGSGANGGMKPLPGGVTHSRSAGQVQDFTNGTESTRDIVRRSMLEAGFVFPE